MKHSFLLLFVLFVLSGRSQQALKIDYSIPSNWALTPDNYPASFQKMIKGSVQDSVDVFYVYPTLLLDKENPRWNIDIDDSVFREKIINSPIKFQASAWANAGKLYAPFYRQAHIRAYSNLENGGRDSLLVAYNDVRAAFIYYLEHFNKGRGIILAGHSQGSTHLSLLLKEFFDGKELQKQLVAAYIPGIGFERNEFQTIPLMIQKDQTGGFVTWNTHKKKLDQRTAKWHLGKAVINPVTWDTTSFAARQFHQGFLFSNEKMYVHSFNTHLKNGVVWISTPHFPYRYLAFTMDNYHVGDVNLFWEDIRQNAILRSTSYLQKK